MQSYDGRGNNYIIPLQIHTIEEMILFAKLEEQLPLCEQLKKLEGSKIMCCANFWINVVMAAATVAAVFVALFGDHWKAKWFAPKLCVTLENDVGELNSTNAKMFRRYYHLRVSNKRRAIANNAIVMLCRIEEHQMGELIEKWHGEVPLTWMFASLSHTIYKNIGAYQLCDLVSLQEDNTMFLEPLFYPNNMPHEWKSAIDVVFTVRVKSDQATSGEKKFEIKWDGEWAQGEAEMKKHLILCEYAGNNSR